MVMEAGSVAPDFELMDDLSEIRKLSDYRGKPIVLYFYPKDDTPGCTKEACNFRDDYSVYQQAGVEILGVSPDSVVRHVKFKTKYDLPFNLLADEDHKVSELYGVWSKKKSFGREYEGINRTSFLIDEGGIIIKVFKRVKPAEHSQQIIEILKKSEQ
jgi:peroxiredoxin Q/BCP